MKGAFEEGFESCVDNETACWFSGEQRSHGMVRYSSTLEVGIAQRSES